MTPSRSPSAWRRRTMRALGAPAIRYQTVELTRPQYGRGSLVSLVAPTVVPLTVVGRLRPVALARLSFGGGDTAEAAGPARTTRIPTTIATRVTRRRYNSGAAHSRRSPPSI